MRTILFVDDEPLLLDGLQNLLRKRRRDWNMHFLPTAKQALQFLEEHPVDILVTDLRMPEMDGAELIQEAYRRYPGIIRMILSGQADQATMARSAPMTHRFLTKPCDPQTLQAALERAVQLLDVMRSEELLRVVGSVGQLPPLPQTYAALTRELGKGDCSLPRAAGLIARDTALSAKVLQIANSAFFGPGRNVASVEQAAVYLGLNTLRNLILVAYSALWSGESSSCPGFSPAETQKHALLTAAIAAKLVPRYPQTEELITAALLHDIGVNLMSVRLPSLLSEAHARARIRSCPTWEAERELMGTTHAALGAYLLDLWGVPPAIVEPIGFHHSPGILRTQEFGMGALLYVADELAEQVLPVESAHFRDTDLPEFLASFEMAGRLPSWERMATEEAAALGEISWL